MRKEFAEFLHGEMSYNGNIVLITGDLGYGLWDRIKIDYSDRFYNVMSSEQLMVGTAVGLAMEYGLVKGTIDTLKRYGLKDSKDFIYYF